MVQPGSTSSTWVSSQGSRTDSDVTINIKHCTYFLDRSFKVRSDNFLILLNNSHVVETPNTKFRKINTYVHVYTQENRKQQNKILISNHVLLHQPWQFGLNSLTNHTYYQQ